MTIPRPGRNEPCHCGSGKKFKKCHGAVSAEEASRSSEATKEKEYLVRLLDEEKPVELTHFRREALLPRPGEDDLARRAKEFTLILAVSYNTIRTVIALSRLFERTHPMPVSDAPSPELGEFSGVVTTVRLLLIQQLHSLFRRRSVR